MSEDTKKQPDNRHIIQKVLFTEKSYEAQEEDSTKPSIYVFQVEKKATKPDIKRAVVTAFGLSPQDVISVNTMITHGKFKRKGSRHGGHAPDRKKAIVTLKAGKVIEALQRG